MKKLALSMIIKNEVEELDRCLSSLAKYVDGIYILQTGDNPKTEEVCRKYNAVLKKDTTKHIVTKEEIEWLKQFFTFDPLVKEGDELFLFDVARNKALEIVPKDFQYVMWLDADDIVRNAHNIKNVLDLMDKNQASAVFLNYLYDVDIDENNNIKNVVIEHLRERIVLNDGRYKWVAPIHETLICQTGEVRQIESRDVDVIHLSSREKKISSIDRNIKVLEKSIFDNKGRDPRPIYYLAKCFYDLHTAESYAKCENLIFRYLFGESPSGWSEERAQAYEYLSEIYRARGEHNKSIKASLNALVESPKFPSTFLQLGLSNLQKGNVDHAMAWVQLATKVPMPQTTLVLNPRDMAVRTLEIIYNASLKTGKLEEAWAAMVKLKDIFPQDPGIDQQFKFISELKAQKEVTKLYVELVKVLQHTGEKDKLLALSAAAPRLIENNPIVSDFIKQVKPPKIWQEKSVVIHCGPGWTVWNPKLLKKSGAAFIGGSEEAVIYASQELVKQGYAVTVYGDPGEEGVYDGVEYLNYFKFNPKDTFNILIGWRQPFFFDTKFQARKTYLWLHDVPNPMELKKERLENITKIMVLSKAQRSLLPQIPDEKFFITSNGFVEEHPEIKAENIQTRCIWTSSYDRGLEHLLEIWPGVKKAVPTAELRIFYGWQLFDKFYYNNPERQAWKQKIEGMMKYDGIYHGGRIEQHELEKEIKKAGVWSYPTDFFEINCISAIKAQAFGAFPVTMNYAALTETVQYGYKVDGNILDKQVKELYKNHLIAWLLPENKELKKNKEEMMQWAKDTYSWSTIIKNWIAEYETI